MKDQMPKISYTIKYNKNTRLIMSPSELISLYFYGVDIKSQDGSSLSNETILTYIKAATDEIQKFLDIKLVKQFIEENVDYYADRENANLPIIVTSFFINEPLSLVGKIGGSTIIKYPRAWFSVKKSNQDQYRKQFRLLPTGIGASTESGQVILQSSIASLAIFGHRNIPNYYVTQYITGFEKMPYDILNVIGKLASIGLFNIAGDIILGAGIANMSLGIDGLSQSIGTTSSATSSGYGSRIIQYQKEIKNTLDRLKKNYKTINLTVL